MLEQLLEAAPRFFSYYNILFLLQALLATFLLSLVGCVLGFLLGFVLAVTRRTTGWQLAPLRGIVIAYTEAFRRALPHLPAETLYWRIYFMMGAYRYTLLRTGRLEMLSGAACDSGDFETAVERIVPFLCAGLSATA